jgi:transposase
MAKAIDYNLGRWQALTRFLDDGALPFDNFGSKRYLAT